MHRDVKPENTFVCDLPRKPSHGFDLGDRREKSRNMKLGSILDKACVCWVQALGGSLGV